MEPLLQLQVASARKKEAELKHELKAATRDETRRTTLGPKLVTAWMRSVALRLFVLADGSAEASVRYLRGKGRTVAEVEVRAWYEAMPAEDRCLLLKPSPDDGRATRQLAEAQKWLKEMRLASWVEDLNSSKGVAPTSSCILERVGPDVASGCNRRNKYRWVRRCMQRWGGHRDRFGSGDGLSADDFRAKVSCALARPTWLAG